MHSFPLEKQVKIVIASMALHNFIRINARMDMEFKPYDDDQGLLPLNEEESRVDSLVRKMVHIIQERWKNNVIELQIFSYLIDV
ncbi:hypothetical protein CK203_117786 [Vitis vinifera]|uniref:DDE Tnp4 domain-containing protein n=1 Tax=Vitis vinifera TaxID=29760 RepID=A0A438FD17_VITVI|nr:hypothetical protein CK203_117786 [Vitis vinifera]